MTYMSVDFKNITSNSELKKSLKKHGAIVIKNVLSQDELARYRTVVTKFLSQNGTRLMLGKTQPNAAVIVNDLDPLFSHPKVIDIFKRIYGEENVVFTGHCDIHMNMISGWHKDSGEAVGGYFRGEYFNAPNCRVYKVAVYLQDADSGDGLTVRLGSHNSRSITAGKEVKLETNAGDLIIFDVRLNHIGRTPNVFERMLKNASRVLNLGDRNKPDAAFITSLASMAGKIVGRNDRLSIFFTYGPPNSFTYDFAYLNMQRQLKQTSVKQTRLRSELVKSLKLLQVEPFDFDAYDPVFKGELAKHTEN